MPDEFANSSLWSGALKSGAPVRSTVAGGGRMDPAWPTSTGRAATLHIVD